MPLSKEELSRLREILVENTDKEYLLHEGYPIRAIDLITLFNILGEFKEKKKCPCQKKSTKK